MYILLVRIVVQHAMFYKCHHLIEMKQNKDTTNYTIQSSGQTSSPALVVTKSKIEESIDKETTNTITDLTGAQVGTHVVQ